MQMFVRDHVEVHQHKKNRLHVHHTFLCISLPFWHDYHLKMPNFALNGQRKLATTKFYFSF